MPTRFYAAFIVALVGAIGCGDDGSSTSDAQTPDTFVEVPIDAPPPTYDTCAGAAILTFGNGGVATAVANVAGAADDTAASCGGTGGADVVYQFTTASVGTLLVNVQPTQGSTARPVVSMRTSCSAANTEFGGCVTTAIAGTSTLQVVRGLAAGTYYLWIDSADGQTGSFNVSVSLVAAAGDACSAPAPLTLTGGQTTVAASTAGATNDETGTCGGSLALDNVFRFDLATLSNIEVTVTPKIAGTQPVVYLQTTCGGSDYACAAAPTTGATASLRLGSVPAGTQYLWVDGANATPGNYELTARITAPAPGDTCANAAPLLFNTGVETVTGDTSSLFNDASGTCASGTAPDSVYVFTTTTVQNLRVDVTTTTTTYQPAVYLRSASCTGGQLACGAATTAGGTGTLSIGALPVGTYYLFIDGVGGTGGQFTMNAALTTPTAGDTCSVPKTLTFTNGMASDTGNTMTWFNDSTGTCASGTSPDGVYMFTTSSVQDLRVMITTSTGTYQPAVYLRSASCTGTQLGCAAATIAGGGATLDVPGLTAGTYYLWIDGVNGTEGTYAISAALTNPLPGERCTNPEPLVFSGGAATATGNTTNMFNDASGTCNSGTAADAVYSFTTASVQDLQVTVSTSTGTYQPAVYLRSASCTGTQLGCATAIAAGGTATLSVGGLAAGTYYLWIDGVGTTAGAYTVNANLTTPAAGERCLNPLALTFSNGQAGGTASATGNLTSMFNDSTGTCGGSTGNDAVYSFTTNVARSFSASVSTTTSTYRPVLYLRSASCTGTQLGCAVAVSDGGTATLNVATLTAGTYYLWVDSASTVGGAYTLNANLAALPPAEVRWVTPTNVVVPGPMSVTYQVVDAFGNVVTTDNSTRFTVTVTGSAVITSATQGTIISGTGTNSVVVQVSGGIVTLTATDSTPETVTYTAIDSQANGLAYPTGTASQTAPTQDLTSSNTFNLTFAQRPSGNGTLTVRARGDFDLSSEYLEVWMESLVGTFYGNVFVTGGSQCPTTSLVATVTIPQADLMTHLSDGVATIVTRPSLDVDYGFLCTTDDVSVTLSFPTSNTAQFLP